MPRLQASVSLGNVPQLAVDVMLANTPFQRIGYIGDGSTTQPFVGAADPSPPDGQPSSGIVTGGLEGEYVPRSGGRASLGAVYGSSSHKAVVIQQRSPTIKVRRAQPHRRGTGRQVCFEGRLGLTPSADKEGRTRQVDRRLYRLQQDLVRARA